MDNIMTVLIQGVFLPLAVWERKNAPPLDGCDGRLCAQVPSSSEIPPVPKHPEYTDQDSSNREIQQNHLCTLVHTTKLSFGFPCANSAGFAVKQFD